MVPKTHVMAVMGTWVRVAFTVICIGVFICEVSGQQMGIPLPPEFEMRNAAARKAMLDGKWLESLRQTCAAIQLLGSPKNRPPNWAFVKARFHTWKALVLSELGCKKHALASYEHARDVLTNQGNVGVNDPIAKAELDFVAGSIHRPEFLEDAEGDPYRWRQALDRCGQELERVAGGAPIHAGRQRVELARVCMFLARRNFRENGDAVQRSNLLQDARNYLDAAREHCVQTPSWRAVSDPDNPLQFRNVDELEKQGLIKLEDALDVKEFIKEGLASWTDWRLAQAELQAELSTEIPALGWTGDKARIEFDELRNHLATQYGRDEHPIVFKTLLTRAKWYVGTARREIEKGKLTVPPPNAIKPADNLARGKCYRRAVGRLIDAIGETEQLRQQQLGNELLKKKCVYLEKEAMELLLDLEDNAQGIDDLLPEEKRPEQHRARDRARIAVINQQIANGDFQRAADAQVNHLGCPSAR